MISIVDYGLGNILAFQNIYKKLNIPTSVVSTHTQLEGSEKIILPGVGSFDWAMSQLNQSGMRETLDQLVLKKKVPVMGICVGMQMMAKQSEEGDLDGLGWIDARVKRFDDSTKTSMIQLPHMGWNDVVPTKPHALFDGLEKDSRFYFLHSYFFATEGQDQILAQTDYNGVFASSVHNGNVFGVQFHPEKSHHWGVRLLKNFAEIAVC
jgi:imidazole glycerol-phosphate synthase subunit HisH